MGAVPYVAMIGCRNGVKAQPLSATDDTRIITPRNRIHVCDQTATVSGSSPTETRGAHPINEPRPTDPPYRFVLRGSPLDNRLGLYWHQSFSCGRR